VIRRILKSILVSGITLTGLPKQMSASRPAVPRAQSVQGAGQKADGIQFSYGGNVAQIPAQVVDALVLVPVRVNGSQPSWFLLDTARPSSAIDDVRAVAVGLYAPSAGGNTPKSFNNVRLDFPGLRISVPELAMDSFGDLSARTGHAIQGVLGADVLSRLIIKIDYQGQAVQFYDPTAFQYHGKGLKFPMVVVRGIPAIQGKIAINHRGNFRGTFALSTAQTEPLEFSQHFASANSLFDQPERTIPFPDVNAANDTDFRDRIGRVHAIQFGKISFANPIAIFPGKTSESTGVPRDFIGAIGGEMLNRFTVILDYPAQSLFLEPNRSFPDVFAFDMSGLTLIAIPPAFHSFEVARVAEKSPAAESGIQVGDMIEEADGNSLSGDTLDQLKVMLREAGTSHTLKVRRNGKRFTVTLNLKPLV
jgi:PDZ domain-containing protein